MMNRKITLAVLASTLLCAPMALSAGKPAYARDPVVPVTGAPESFADLASRLSPTVVNISSTQKIEEAQDYPEIPQFPPGSPFQHFR